MNFKIGDHISVLDEDISGVVLNINSSSVIIETTDGFELTFSENELIKVDSQLELQSNISSEVIREKSHPKKKPSKKAKIKERFQPAMEVDLHIHHLTDKKGLSNYDMLTLQLDTARRQLEFAIKKRIQKVVFIHGVGEGVLKAELEYLFGRYNNVKYYDANYQKYGLGATEIYIYQNVKPED